MHNTVSECSGQTNTCTPDGRANRRNYLPLAPLEPFIRLAAKDMRARNIVNDAILPGKKQGEKNIKTGLRGAAELIALRLDKKPTSVLRNLDRLFGGGSKREFLEVYTADEYAIALGYHPCEIWGDEWFKQA